MNLTTVAIVSLGFLLFGLVSKRLGSSFLTGPLLFSLFGLSVGPFGINAVSVELSHEALHVLAEVTLILVLFSDAASTDLVQLRKDHNLPVRMLVIGMPLTIVAGTLVAAAFFTSLSIWEAALLAAILAPTDAALGQTVVTSSLVPVRIRQALNVESGLNDGVALPVVVVLAGLAAVGQSTAPFGELLVFGAMQVTIGPIAGIVVGYLGARSVALAYRQGWLNEEAEGIVALAIAFLAFALAGLVGGNGFIAAFIAGLTFGNSLGHMCRFLFTFAEAEGLFLVLMTFFVFGGVMLPEALVGLNPTYFVFGFLSLTVLRVVPVWLSLIGTRVKLVTAGFLGWFGPRGLASVLFVLLILEESEIAGRDTIFSAVMVTVMLSIVLHGVSAGPGAGWYGRRVAMAGECEETKLVAAQPFADRAARSVEP